MTRKITKLNFQEIGISIIQRISINPNPNPFLY
jgi:hypothetical protein